MNDISIISQNLYNYKKKNTISPEDYIKKYSATYYAFQEYPDVGRGKTFYTTIVNSLNEKIIQDEYWKIIGEWNKYFPWGEMPLRYWSEAKIIYSGEEIFLLNVHLSTSYTEPLRLILLCRLKQLKNKKVILMGDFNTAFSEQTELKIEDNNKFLSMILKHDHVELLDEDEQNNNPHYTFAIENKKKKCWVRKKLDHIFVSKSLKEDAEISITIEYLDSTNINVDKIVNNNIFSDAISDHTGIKVNIKRKNP